MALDHDGIYPTSGCIRLRRGFAVGICMIRIQRAFIHLLCVRTVRPFNSIMTPRRGSHCLIESSKVERCEGGVLYAGFLITCLNASCHFHLLLYFSILFLLPRFH